MENEKILLGRVNGLFGVKGWIKVYSYTQPRQKITQYKHWFLGPDSRHLVVEGGHAHNAGVVAKLAGIDNRDQAVALLNQTIWVAADQLEALGENEYYWFQLIGLDVYDLQHRCLGEIKDLMETGANDVLVVVDQHQHEHLIPYIQDRVVRSIDLPNRRMVVDWDTGF